MTLYDEQINKLKEKYHCKFRKNTDKNKDYMEQLLERAMKEYNEHSAFDPYTRENGITNEDRLELKVLTELIKLYQSRAELKRVQYTSC